MEKINNIDIDNYPKHLNPFENEIEENENNSNRLIANQNERTPLIKSDINRINSEEELIELQYGNNCCCTIL